MRYKVKLNGHWDWYSREGEATGPGLICDNCGEVVKLLFNNLCEKCFTGDKATALRAWIGDELPAQYTR
jgi:hypothetical protein